MSEDIWRTALAEALEERFSYATQYATLIIDWDEEAEALLPTVRRIVAEELRAMAEEIRPNTDGGFESALRFIYAADRLNARAAALDTPDHGKA